MALLIVPPTDPEPWPTLGPQVCDLLEERCVHGPGDLRGKDYKLDDEKRALIYRWYEVYPKGHPREGKRRFKRAGLSVRKGTAKTELAAAVAFAELHPEGPVRCDGFRKEGGVWIPVGRPVTDPYIPMVAYTEEQTEDLAYAALLVMVAEGEDADLFDAGLERIMRIGGDGKAVALAAAPDSRDGARTTFQHFDETHRFTLRRLKEAHQTMLANIPKRMMADPWSLETTTTYTPGEGSVAEGTHEYAELVEQGKAKDKTLFFFHREAAPKIDEDLDDFDQAADAVIEASGPSIATWPDFEGQVEAIVSLRNQPDTDKAYWERVWLNRRVQAGKQAFDVKRWESLARPDFMVPKGSLITIGFDGSQFHDATALIATGVESGHQWPLGIWECPSEEENWECPENEVDDVLKQAFNEYEVWRMYADPPYWDGMVNRWRGRWGEKRVIEWWTHRPLQMAYSLRAYGGAMTSGELSHSGDETFAKHIGNSRRHALKQKDDKGKPLWTIRKERADSPFKIDAAMAGDLSWEARCDAISAGATRSTSSELYTASSTRRR
ncbi:large terminase [Streptosporangium amethystogenes subsp. fukuiense]